MNSFPLLPATRVYGYVTPPQWSGPVAYSYRWDGSPSRYALNHRTIHEEMLDSASEVLPERRLDDGGVMWKTLEDAVAEGIPEAVFDKWWKGRCSPTDPRAGYKDTRVIARALDLWAGADCINVSRILDPDAGFSPPAAAYAANVIEAIEIYEPEAMRRELVGMSTVTEQIRSAVAAFGSQIELARFLDVTRTSVSNWATGIREPSDLNTREALEVTYAWGQLLLWLAKELAAPGAAARFRLPDPALREARYIVSRGLRLPSRWTAANLYGVLDALLALEVYSLDLSGK